MRIVLVDTMCISKEKALRHYVDFIVKVFKEKSEITQRGRLNAN